LIGCACSTPISRTRISAHPISTSWTARVVTNSHVIDGCTSHAIRNHVNEIDGEVQVVARDPANDLALFKTSLRPSKVAPVRAGVRLGESVATFGFPHIDMLDQNGNFTRGDVSALAGIGNNTSMLQMSTPVQSGNSGGALLDRSGNVVGVVRGKLGLKSALKTGDLPQNVNFSIKAATLMSFLDSNGVSYRSGTPGEALDPTELPKSGKPSAPSSFVCRTLLTATRSDLLSFQLHPYRGIGRSPCPNLSIHDPPPRSPAALLPPEFCPGTTVDINLRTDTIERLKEE
jgi:S1-C subfamily serine protease